MIASGEMIRFTIVVFLALGVEMLGSGQTTRLTAVQHLGWLYLLKRETRNIGDEPDMCFCPSMNKGIDFLNDRRIPGKMASNRDRLVELHSSVV